MIAAPLRRAAAACADDLTLIAARVGAASVLTRLDSGRIEGGNCEPEAFRRALEEAGVAVAGHDAVVFGAGGAARSVAWSLRHADAENLAQDLGANEIYSVLLDAARAMAEAVTRIVIATPPSVWPEVAPVAAHEEACLIDLSTVARGETPAVRWARRRGLQAMDGSAMLKHHTALVLERWRVQPE